MKPDVEPAEDDPDAPLATVLVLRDDETGQLATAEATPDNRAIAREGAKRRKALFDHRLAGAQARSGRLPRLLTASFAAGTVNLMLAKLLQEEIVPATAKEAADVAKIAHEIYKTASGVADGRPQTPEERIARLEEVRKLEATLAARAKEASAPLQGAPQDGEELAVSEPLDAPAVEVEPIEWEIDEDG